MKEDKRPLKGNWAPGNYCVKCTICNARFLGDKRATQCADCAYERSAKLESLPSWIDNRRNKINAIVAKNYRCVITETKEKDYSMVVMLLEVPEFPTNAKESSILNDKRLAVVAAYQYEDEWTYHTLNVAEKTCIGNELIRLNSKVKKWYWCELYTT